MVRHGCSTRVKSRDMDNDDSKTRGKKGKQEKEKESALYAYISGSYFYIASIMHALTHILRRADTLGSCKIYRFLLFAFTHPNALHKRSLLS